MVRISGAPSAVAMGSAHLRQQSLNQYGLTASETMDPDPSLTELVERARTTMQADYASVDVLTTSRQLRIAGSLGVHLGVSDLRMSLSQRIFEPMPQLTPFCTPDAAQDPLLKPLVADDDISDGIHFFAAAPLIGQEGVMLGALCVWSRAPRATSADDLTTVASLAAETIELLDARRGQPVIPSQSGPADTGMASASDAREPEEWDIGAIIDKQAIRTLFQPVVHLDSGTVVGFEALSRGPEGSSLEMPMAMLEAAAGTGRLGELDWVCRVHAMQAAAASGLPPSMSWMINVEPDGLDLPCPEHLLPALAQAQSELRVVLEVVERGIEVHVPELLRACDQARQFAWGVALDDVGAESISLALLPILQPDVVKLDMTLLRNTDEHASARTMAAVHAYAERFNAVVLAEGIETEEQEQLARAFGAHFGQGFRYGRPGPLPESLPAPREVIPLRQRAHLLTNATPYEILAEHKTVRTSTREAIRRVIALLEESALNAREPGVVLAVLPSGFQMPDELRERFRRLAAANALTIVFGDGLAESADGGFQTSPIPRSIELSREWAAVVMNVDDVGAVVARDTGTAAPDGTHRIAHVYTHNRDLVIGAARSLISSMLPEAATHWLGGNTGGPEPSDAPPTQISVTEPEDEETPSRGRGFLRRRASRSN